VWSLALTSKGKQQLMMQNHDISHNYSIQYIYGIDMSCSKF
jgi:hypothetical protein